MPFCTVIIINYNSLQYLERCLHALSQQTFSDFDVQIIDNASEKPPGHEVLKIVPQTHFIKNNRNHGFAGANNQAFFGGGNARWFILLNPDAFPEKDFIEKLVIASNKYKDVSLFGSRLYYESMPDIVEGDGDYYHISGLAWRKQNMHRNSCSNKPFEAFTACAAAFMIKAELVQKVGGFDDDFFCYMEDVDLGFRMRLIGQRCIIVPDSRAYHIGSGTSGGQHSDFVVYHGQRNIIWTYVKNMPWPLLWLFLPLHVGLNLVTIFWFSLRGQKNLIWKAKTDALKGLPKMWRKRKIIQNQKVARLSDILRFMDKNPIPLDWIKKKIFST